MTPINVSVTPTTANVWSALSSATLIGVSNNKVSVNVNFPNDGSGFATALQWELWANAYSGGPFSRICSGNDAVMKGSGAYPVLTNTNPLFVVDLPGPFYSIGFRALHNNPDNVPRTITFQGQAL